MHFNGIFLWCYIGTVLTGIFYTLMDHLYVSFETLSVEMFLTFRTLFLDPSVHSMEVSFKSMSVSKNLVTLSAKNVTFWQNFLPLVLTQIVQVLSQSSLSIEQE